MQVISLRATSADKRQEKRRDLTAERKCENRESNTPGILYEKHVETSNKGKRECSGKIDWIIIDRWCTERAGNQRKRTGKINEVQESERFPSGSNLMKT